MGAAYTLQAIWEESRDDVRAQVEIVCGAVADALAGALTDETRVAAAREAHKLTGSVGSLGFLPASDHARELEQALKAPGGLTAGDLPRLAEIAVALRNALHADRAPSPAHNSSPEADASPAVLFVSADGERLHAWQRAAAQRGSSATLAADLTTARRALAQSRSHVVVLDLEITGDRREALSFLAEAAASVQAMVLAPDHEPIDRVEIGRRGAKGLLSRSLDAASVVAAALDLGHRRRLAGSRALLVDDDQTFLAALRPVLEASGVQVSTADGPAGFWQRLEDVGPDIIVLDFEMPGVSGAELCRALRNEPRWASVPVMFMTSRTDPETVGAIFEAGADDYVTKPFSGEEVVARIKNRLDRAGLQAATAEADLPSGIVESPAPLPATDIESENGTVVQHVDVVVIEDDVVLARLLVHALETRGYRTRLISDGEMAAAELAGAAPTLGAPLLLLDWDLPGLDGLRLLRTLRERGVLDRSRVIMLTARGTEAEVLQALQAGAADHVTKPFSVPVLMRRVHNALER